MRLIVLFVLFVSTFESNTFIKFNSQGIEHIIRTFIDLNTPKFKQTIEINQEYSFGVGDTYIKKIDISDIIVNSKEIKVSLLPNVKGIHIQGHLDSVSIKIDTAIKVFGFVLFDGNIQLKLKETKAALTIQLDSRSNDNGLQFSLWENKLDILRLGFVHFEKGDSLIEKVLGYVADGLADLVLFFAKFRVAGMVSDEITKLGANLPNNIALTGTFDGVIIPLQLTKTPTIGTDWVNIDFKCGVDTNRIERKNQPDFEIRIGQECINDILQQVYSLNPSPINITAIAQSISDMTEINTKTLGGIFPGFINQPEPVDVKFEVTLKQGSAGLSMSQNSLKVDAPLKARLFLIQSQELNRQAISVGRRIEILNRFTFQEKHYMDFNATLCVQIGVVKTFKGFTMSIIRMNTKDYEITPEDEEENLIDTESWDGIKDVALAFAQSPANSVLYEKVILVDGYLDMQSIDILIEDPGVAFVLKSQKNEIYQI